jgi:organic hydroperoxide reductase OsmC/OhrA
MPQAFPHHYRTRAEATPEGPVRVGAEGLASIETLPPPEFDGPGGYWSPETLLLSAVADCFTLTFRRVARASKLEWEDLQVEVHGVLDRVDEATRFTHLTIAPRLRLAAGASETLALTVLKKAKSLCLISNSLNATSELAPQVLAAAAQG